MSNKKSEQKDLAPSAEGLAERAREIWLAGLGALAAAEDEGVRLYRELIEKGKSFENQGRPRVEEVGDRAREVSQEALERFETLLAETTEVAMKRFGVPSREEVEKLSEQVDHLTVRVEELTALLKKDQKK